MIARSLKKVYPILMLVFSCIFFLVSFYIGRPEIKDNQSVLARSAILTQRQALISQSIENGQQQYQFESDNPIPYFVEETNK